MSTRLFNRKVVENAPTALAKERDKENPWLEAWKDPVASLNAMLPCFRLVDLQGNGDYRLVAGSLDKRLRVYGGTALKSETVLLGQPSSVCTFYESLDKPIRPALAVAIDSTVFVYRNLRPFFKIELPLREPHEREVKIWEDLKKEDVDWNTAVQDLQTAKEEGIQLSNQSIKFLAIEDDSSYEANCEAFVKAHKDKPLAQPTVATCMESMNKNIAGDRQLSNLVIGTESRLVLIMDSTGKKIIHKVKLPAVPAFIAVHGELDVDYRIIVACRDRSVYSIKKGRLMGGAIHLDSQPCGLGFMDSKYIVVGCMNSTMYSYHVKGKKIHTWILPSPISCMQSVQIRRSGHDTCLTAVGLRSGEVRLFNKSDLVHTLQYTEPAMALRLGPYGREDTAMVLSFKGGALMINMLKRTAKFNPMRSVGPPAEQSQPIQIPKKSRLFAEQAEREKEQCVAIHKAFQKQFIKMRLTTAQSYVKILTDATGPLSFTQGSSLRMEANVMGLGPVFRICLSVKNSGRSSVLDVPVTFSYDHNLYSLDQQVIQIPVLVPGVSYEYRIRVVMLDPAAPPGKIRVYIVNPASTLPALSAIVNMPASELDED